ncbi:type IV pilus modification PilV family protein [Paraliobacillus ryukyuensis]|uniref:type IV pilus modification PilV family protein n=1 Tax=Paraliobacillus ryukyuensis TaxID=200904 RepID=UPI0009A6BC43|nr:type II secretion system protein [Paraliobacillus ryukyuensis]
MLRFQRQQPLMKEEKAMTLVEVLVSIMILSIIVVTFLTFFIQSRKTVNLSDDISDATYTAQTEVEYIYHLSETKDFDTALNDLKVSDPDGDGEVQFTKEVDGEKVEVAMSTAKDSNGNVIDDKLKSVLVKVYDQSNKLKGQMETKILWEE